MKNREDFRENSGEEKDVELFRREMREMKKEEEKLGEMKKTAHFEGLNPEELSAADGEIWSKFKEDALTLEDFNEYRVEIFRSGNASQKNFAAFLANKIMIRQIEKEDSDEAQG